MKKTKQTHFEIEWKQTGKDPNDLIAKVGEDTLRVEQMDIGHYWWAVYIGGEDYHSLQSGAKTLEEGKRKAEKLYKELKNEKEKSQSNQ